MAALCSAKPLIYRGGVEKKPQNQTNEAGGGRNSMAIIAISLPSLGTRCLVATVFVLWEKGGDTMCGRGWRAAGPLPPSCGSECAGGLTLLWAALTPSFPKKWLQVYFAVLKIIIKKIKMGGEAVARGAEAAAGRPGRDGAGSAGRQTPPGPPKRGEIPPNGRGVVGGVLSLLPTVI